MMRLICRTILNGVRLNDEPPPMDSLRRRCDAIGSRPMCRQHSHPVAGANSTDGRTAMTESTPGEEPSHTEMTLTAGDGSRLVAHRTGSGAPIIFIHGSAGGLDSWNTVTPLLADEYQLWVY